MKNESAKEKTTVAYNIPANTEFEEITPGSKTKYYKGNYEAIIPLGKDATIHIITSDEGIGYLKSIGVI
jgi:hypothetical protein